MKNLLILALVVFAWFTVVMPPPREVPNAETIQWQEGHRPSTLTSVALSTVSWQVENYGPIAFASGRVPFTDVEFHLVGYTGEWYNNATPELPRTEYAGK